jgi:GT2 family glycosyltransferase
MPASLSVIFPVLNNRTGFCSAIDPIIDLQANDIELIVIDGGSNDGTLDEIKRREKHLSYWESGLDSGIADAFNRGISRCTGEFIAILNSDDHWTPQTLDLFRQYRERFPEASVFFGSIRYRDPSSGYSYVRNPKLQALKYRMWLFHPAMIVRRRAYERIGNYDTTVTHAMDSEWSHRALAAGERFIQIPEVLAEMSLGGLSDRDFAISLRQYRDSVIRHQLCRRSEAWIYYTFFLGLKRVMQVPVLQPVKRLRDRLIRRS